MPWRSMLGRKKKENRVEESSEHLKQEFSRQEQARRIDEEQQQKIQEEKMKDRQIELERIALENERMRKQRETSPATLRRLRELIRMKYQLDIEIWSRRGARHVDQELVIEQGRKADAILQEIYIIVDAWDENSWEGKEAQIAHLIQQKLYESVPRVWEGNPPWKEFGVVRGFNLDDDAAYPAWH